MSSGSKSEKALIFETILSGPGMEDSIKVSLPMSRKNILLLCRMIEQELVTKGEGAGNHFFGAFSQEAREEFASVQKLILEKAGLESFYEKLKSLE